MYILTHESEDKKHRRIEKIAHDVLEKSLEEDKGYIEVIPMRDPNIYVRLYFDIDQYDTTKDIINDIIHEMSNEFKCSESDWAIASSNRPAKTSYHVTSTKYCVTLSSLRVVTKKLAKVYPCIDTRPLYFGISDAYECGYFRLPNQSKIAINKAAPPLKIIKGKIRDFFVTYVTELSRI